MNEVAVIYPEDDNGQEYLFHMPVKELSFKIEQAVGTTENTLDYDMNVRGTWVGRVCGETKKNGKLIYLVECLEIEMT
jgi:hypothetical protein